MNIIQFSEKLQEKMKERLNQVNVAQDELIKIGNAMKFLASVISELKFFVKEYHFVNQQEEITFFKEIKPIFATQFIYYKKMLSIRLFDTFKDHKQKQSNYYKLLRQLEAFAAENKEFYEYCLTGATYMDAHYFMRATCSPMSLDLDEAFSTSQDARLAKLLANELLKEQILAMLRTPDGSTSKLAGPELVWTANKTALVELIYALHAVGVLNNGSADIGQIAHAFSSLFNITLGDYYRTFQEIRGRKTGHAKFMDELSKGLQRRINNVN